jgi:hypothetical protein
MGRIAPVLLLLALAACAGEPPAPLPSVPPIAAPAPRPAPPPTVVPTLPPNIAARMPRSGYVQEVDELFRALADQDARDALARRAQAVKSAPPAAAYTIPTVSREIQPANPYAAPAVSYEYNLTTCLDGRLAAFCDRARLTAADAARVRDAEHQAKLAACPDPARRHLCAAEPLSQQPELPRPPSVARASTGARPPSRVASSAYRRPPPSASPPATHLFAQPSPRASPGTNRPAPAQVPRASTASAQVASVQTARLSESDITDRLIRASIGGLLRQLPVSVQSRSGRATLWPAERL